jgi:LmbE family N-acetylglucosaminyl deacetylase
MLVTSDIRKFAIDKGTKVLVIFPHPDDEAFFTCGLVSKAVKAGAIVRLVSMTKGENSTVRHGVASTDDLGNVRSKEFTKVCSMFGNVTCCLGMFPDGAMDQMESEVIEGVKHEINTFRPDVIVTYEPSGVYGHPDHVLLSKVVSNLVASDYSATGLKLIYATVPEIYKPLSENINMARDPKNVRPLTPNIELSLGISEVIMRLRVFGAYKSQMNFSWRRVVRWIKYGMVFSEFFVV